MMKAQQQVNKPGLSRHSPLKLESHAKAIQTDKPLERVAKGSPMNRRTKTNPGPGSYNIRMLFSDSLKNKSGFTIARRLKTERNQEKKPDVWSYSPTALILKKKAPCPSIGNQQRRSIEKDGPSPVAYNSNYKLLFKSTQNAVISQAQVEDKEATPTPGPGYYETPPINKIMKSQGLVKIGSSERYQHSPKSPGPAPNHYTSMGEMQYNQQHRKGFTMASRLRVKTDYQGSSNTFGYNTSKEAILKRGPSYTIKRFEQRMEQFKMQIPGPGYYQNKSKEMRIGAVIGKQRRKTQVVNKSPGPIYAPEILKKGHSFSIPKSSWKVSPPKKSPGPQEYSPRSIESQKNKAIKIGSADRTDFVGSQKAPGPGSYEPLHPASLSNTGGFTISRSKRQSKQDNSSPGPASYKIDFATLKKHFFRRSKE